MFGAGQGHAAGVWGFGRAMLRTVLNRDVIVSSDPASVKWNSTRQRPLKRYKALFIGAIKENYRV